ncbi:MAG: TetR/AcrR family transcriptional regulator [Thermoleophilaceae bacterium]|nr:TetR/AcrR family transcriptional regulator [Thermoleophilaceae bacterium]
MTTTRPRQKRSRERVEKILLAAADELARTADADALTTTSVSRSSGIPVATIYRYFADRSAIISALIDQEQDEINDLVNERIDELEVVTLDALQDTMVRAHFDYLSASRRSMVLWFGARSSKAVLGRVERRYAYMGEWLMSGAVRSGMIREDAPIYGGEIIVWMIDRAYEYIARADRDPETVDEILGLAIRMVSRSVDEFATERGREGISREQFWAAFGTFQPPSGPLAK